MIARGLTPILNVSNMAESFAWFEKLGWSERWHWGDPPGFASVGSGSFEIFLCLDRQGGRGKGDDATGFNTQDKGAWMSIWVDDVDAVHRECIERGIEVTWPPTDHEWNVREMHIRHPDGHVFRVGKSLEETDEE
ncbi:MAG TPA: bleomycin resistance family protein [Gemmatimonadaceae bacterium]|nr:bleomycin resistance family protein [Gemmatimonadaceae bacterium]